MTWVDLVVILALVASALLACLRGFVREALGIIAWLGAAYVAADSGAILEPFYSGFSAEPPIVDALSLGTVFLIALLVFSVVASLLAKLVRGSVLRSLDRSLGVVYGLARGAALVVAAYIVVGLGVHVDRWPTPVLQSRTLPFAYEGAAWVVAQLPETYRPPLQQPPAGREANADALLHATPQGYALSGSGAAARP